MKEGIEQYIETYSGKKFNFLGPKQEDIDIIDIAHSLSMQCRFTGHTKSFYSIAEHSLLVSSLCTDEYKLWGLLHDASESYLTDVASPVKPHLTNYKLMERVIMEPICEKFGISKHMPPEVKVADLEALRIEAHYLMHSGGREWVLNRDHNMDSFVPSIGISCYQPQEAKMKFLEEFRRLTGGQ